MHVAQGLYERGLITYMRTDSTSLSAQAVSAARGQIARMYGDEYLPAAPREYRSKVKNAQEAHEAIRPAGDRMRTVDDVSHELHGSDERRLYDLIWKRTIASQMADARIRRVTLRLVATSTAGEEATFQATGRTIEFAGYLRAYVEGADDPDAELEDRETILPALEEGESVECRELRASGHTTQPPARYTEASLVKELEERGIGRPSTYASVIDTIVRREYVFKKGNALVPTWTAFAKVQLLERYFAHLIDYEFTAVMEEALDAIARGEGEAEKWLHAFYFGNGQIGLRDLVAEEHVATIDKAEVNSVHVGHDADGNELIVRVWPNGANIERGDDRAPIPAELAPDELTPEKAEELLARGAAGPTRCRRRSRHRPHGAGAHRPLRSVRATGRDRERVEGEAEAGVALRQHGPVDGRARGGAGVARAPACRRRRHRWRRDHRAERPLRAVSAQGHRQPQPGCGGTALHRHPRRGARRSSLSPSSAAGVRSSHRSPSWGPIPSRPYRCGCSTAASVPTSPMAP